METTTTTTTPTTTVTALQSQNSEGDGQNHPIGKGKGKGKPQPQKLTRKNSSSSFRLRSPSLNSLRLRRVFEMFDKNGDDLITVEEISQALILLGLDADPAELRSITTSFIRPGHAGLAYQDFEALHKSLNDTFFDCIDNNHSDNDDDADAEAEAEAAAPNDLLITKKKHEEQVESDLTEAFKVFDENGDGYISAKELQQVLSKLGLPEAQQEIHQIQRMISSVDQNHDGRVDFFEFKNMMLHTLLAPSS